MWHFGGDTSLLYSGELFEISWKEGLEIFNVYSKKKKKK